MLRVSSYFEGLNTEAKTRYKQKISFIGGLDPFVDSGAGESTDDVIPVDASDLVSYLVLQTSFITPEQFKARKGLQAYNQFVCGWVKDVKSQKICEKFLVTGRVSPQRFCSLTILF